VVGGIATATGLLDQSLEQLTGRVRAFRDDPDLYGDDKPGREAAHASGVRHAEQAVAQLMDARRVAHQLQRTLAGAASHLQRLGLSVDERDDGGDE
jgi:hypothetical protein